MGVYKGILALFFVLLLWLGGKFLLPLLFPFLLGTLLALAAEPVVGLGVRRLRLRRGLSAGIGVSLTLLFLAGITLLLGALAVRELGTLADRISPVIHDSAHILETTLTNLAQKAPEPVGPMLSNSVHQFFTDGSALTDQAVAQVPGLLSGILGKLPGSAMSIGTGILSGYFISARLPKLRAWVGAHLPKTWHEKTLPALRHLRAALGKWLAAQGKLMVVTYCIVAVGLLLLGIPYAFAWAILAAAVDAIPLLGTGVVLLPWALTKLLQGDLFTAAGLLCIYIAAVVTRTVLEPRFYGKHLGLDPLVMLVFLYFGYRLWGFLGIVISPLLAATTKALTEK